VIYSATTGAIVAMVRSLALELAPEGIRVNCVAPAVVDAGMTVQYQRSVPAETFAHMVKLHPLGLGRAEDVANAVAFLLADTGRWITGTTLVVDGGYSAH
jgi:NAD(P)-dependent dehydrogenase (short-subunit alcohol dehydrogenase family)